jgi:hypothetical protein
MEQAERDGESVPKKQTTSRLGGRSTRSGRPGVLLNEYYEQARE